MGITIHFSGQLRDVATYDRLMQRARAFALENEYVCAEIADEHKKLLRVTDDQKEWDYEGPVTGLRIDLHPDSEPLFLEFDRELYIQEYIKTQFAGAELHAKVIEFLRQIQSLFLNFRVNDEAEFWETNDLSLLRKHIARCAEVIQDEAANHPGCLVKVHTEEGRILDLVT